MQNRVLVVDDVEVNCEVLRNILEDEYAVETAGDGEEAIRWLSEYQEETAALLLDLQMSGMNGFEVMEESKRRGWLKKMPVIIISGEKSADVENQCLCMGASDFIHKPFEASIVKNRVRNTVELFSYKNRLEQEVERQTEVLKEQSHIIQMQAEQLKEADSFHTLMMQYRCAIMEVETKLKVLNEAFSHEYKRNPFETIKSRLKTTESIYEKLRRKNYPVTVENIEEKLNDVAGVRVICSFPDDIYRLAALLLSQDDIFLLKEKDYIKSPKPNGYRSLHLIIYIPIFLSNEKKYMKVEVQFRTIAMDFWASLEHKLKYKRSVNNAEEIVEQLRTCAESIAVLDYQMQDLRDKIDDTGITDG